MRALENLVFQCSITSDHHSHIDEQIISNMTEKKEILFHEFDEIQNKQISK